MCLPVGLRELYRDGRLIPFIGAGVSRSVTWEVNGIEKHGPSWSELVDEAARLLGFDRPDLLRVRGSDIQILEYYKLKNYGHGRLRSWLDRTMQPPQDALQNSVIHKSLIELNRCKIIYTTNYDNYIERSFDFARRPYHVVALEGHIKPYDEQCEIIKFHGDLDFEETMVLSESDYEKRLQLRSPMDYRLRADVLNRALIFIGYSFRDWNVAYLFRLVNDEFKDLPDSAYGHRAYIVVPDPSDFEMRLFRARNIEVIPVSSANITADIANILTEIGR